MPAEKSKTCSKCGVVKPLTEFYRAKGGVGDRRGDCKACLNARLLAYNRANRWVGRKKGQNRKAKRPDEASLKSKRYREENPEKVGARYRVQNATRTGRLVRPESCQECGRAEPVQAHHDDYSKPLEVRWLCQPCHGRAHARSEAALQPEQAARTDKSISEITAELQPEQAES